MITWEKERRIQGLGDVAEDVCVCVHMCVHPLECRVRPSVWVTPPPSSLLPSHPPTHLTPPAASNCSHHLILRLWLHTGQLRILFLRQHAPDSTPSCRPLPSLLYPPPFPAQDHVTFRKASPTSPLLLLTLSWPARCQRLSTAGCLAASSPLKRFQREIRRISNLPGRSKQRLI